MARNGLFLVAWYQVTQNVGVTNSVHGSVTSSTSTLGSDITLTVTFDEATSGDMAGVELTDTSGNAHVYNTQTGTLVPATATSKGTGTARMKVVSSNSVPELVAAQGAYHIYVTSKTFSNKCTQGQYDALEAGAKKTASAVKANDDSDADTASRIRLVKAADVANVYNAGNLNGELDYTIYITKTGTLSWTSVNDAGTAAATGVTETIKFSIDGQKGGADFIDYWDVSGAFYASGTARP